MRLRPLVLLLLLAAAIPTGASGGLPPEPLAPAAWHLERVGATASPPPAPGVPIAVIDSTVDGGFPDLATETLTLLDEPCDGFDTPHATSVAAIAAAPLNGLGSAGVWPGAALWSADACDLADRDLIAAIDRSIARGRAVITIPLGGPGYSRPLYVAVLRAVQAGSLVVAAAGNYRDRGDPLTYPAAYPHVLTVASTGRTDEASPFSGTRGVDVAAPGEEIPVFDPEQPERPTLLTGTSFATPTVAAAAAWIWTARPELDASEVAEILRRSARDVGPPGFDRATGFGVVDIAAALAEPAPGADPQEPNDDVDQVAAGRLFRRAKPGLTSLRTIAGRVDRAEDPRDLYRLRIRPGARAELRIEATGRIRLSLWGPEATSVERGTKGRLATRQIAPPSGRLAYTNRSGRTLTVYVEIRPLEARAEYTLRRA